MESNSSGRKDPRRADAITRVIAARVADLREKRGLSGAKLGAAVRELGVKGWVDSTVGKLETLRRESVTVTELLALAKALDVPPAWLLADPSQDTPVPIVEGVEMAPWDALLWFVGRTRDRGWMPAAEPFQAALKVTDLVDALGESRAQGLVDLVLPDREEAEEARQHRDAADRQRLRFLAYLLGEFEKWEVQPPPVDGYVLERARELGIELPGLSADDDEKSEGGRQ